MHTPVPELIPFQEEDKPVEGKCMICGEIGRIFLHNEEGVACMHKNESSGYTDEKCIRKIDKACRARKIRLEPENKKDRPEIISFLEDCNEMTAFISERMHNELGEWSIIDEDAPCTLCECEGKTRKAQFINASTQQRLCKMHLTNQITDAKKYMETDDRKVMEKNNIKTKFPGKHSKTYAAVVGKAAAQIKQEITNKIKRCKEKNRLGQKIKKESKKYTLDEEEIMNLTRAQTQLCHGEAFASPEFKKHAIGLGNNQYTLSDDGICLTLVPRERRIKLKFTSKSKFQEDISSFISKLRSLRNLPYPTLFYDKRRDRIYIIFTEKFYHDFTNIGIGEEHTIIHIEVGLKETTLTAYHRGEFHETKLRHGDLFGKRIEVDRQNAKRQSKKAVKKRNRWKKTEKYVDTYVKNLVAALMAAIHRFENPLIIMRKLSNDTREYGKNRRRASKTYTGPRVLKQIDNKARSEGIPVLQLDTRCTNCGNSKIHVGENCINTNTTFIEVEEDGKKKNKKVCDICGNEKTITSVAQMICPNCGETLKGPKGTYEHAIQNIEESKTQLRCKKCGSTKIGKVICKKCGGKQISWRRCKDCASIETVKECRKCGGRNIVYKKGQKPKCKDCKSKELTEKCVKCDSENLQKYMTCKECGSTKMEKGRCEDCGCRDIAGIGHRRIFNSKKTVNHTIECPTCKTTINALEDAGETTIKTILHSPHFTKNEGVNLKRE